MNITGVSKNINCKQPAFSGRILTTGFNWSSNASLKEAFINSKMIKQLTNKHDVVGRLTKEGQYFSEKLYKIKISLLKENSLLDKIKNFLGIIHKESLTFGPHRKHTLLAVLEDKDRIENLKQAFKITD